MLCSTLQFFNEDSYGSDAYLSTETSSDTSQTVNMAGGSLSQSVFHWSKPQILTATAAGSLLVWHVMEDLAANHSLPMGGIKVFQLQNDPITALTITDR